MSTDVEGTKWRRDTADNFNRLSRVHERYRRQTTDGRRHITFAKNWCPFSHSTESRRL